MSSTICPLKRRASSHRGAALPEYLFLLSFVVVLAFPSIVTVTSGINSQFANLSLAMGPSSYDGGGIDFIEGGGADNGRGSGSKGSGYFPNGRFGEGGNYIGGGTEETEP